MSAVEARRTTKNSRSFRPKSWPTCCLQRVRTPTSELSVPPRISVFQFLPTKCQSSKHSLTPQFDFRHESRVTSAPRRFQFLGIARGSPHGTSLLDHGYRATARARSKSSRFAPTTCASQISPRAIRWRFQYAAGNAPCPLVVTCDSSRRSTSLRRHGIRAKTCMWTTVWVLPRDCVSELDLAASDPVRLQHRDWQGGSAASRSAPVPMPFACDCRRSIPYQYGAAPLQQLLSGSRCFAAPILRDPVGASDVVPQAKCVETIVR